MPASKSHLRDLAGSESAIRAQGADGIFQRVQDELSRERDLSERFREILEAEWRAVGDERSMLIGSLLSTLKDDENLFTIEVAAMALATEGEDGLTELVPLLGHDDFAIRSKAVIAISLLDRSARWAVRILVRAIRDEPVWLVQADLVRALGRIGGSEAATALDSLLGKVGNSSREDRDLCDVIVAALAHARLQEALE